MKLKQPITELTIEKGVPLPTGSRGPQAILAAAVRQMEIGDSIVWHVRDSPRTVATECGYKVVTRKQPDGMFRIWRTA